MTGAGRPADRAKAPYPSMPGAVRRVRNLLWCQFVLGVLMVLARAELVPLPPWTRAGTAVVTGLSVAVAVPAAGLALRMASGRRRIRIVAIAVQVPLAVLGGIDLFLDLTTLSFQSGFGGLLSAVVAAYLITELTTGEAEIWFSG